METQKTIAKRFNISQMSVSRILNDKPGVSKELKRKVLSYIENEGCYINRIASSLISGKTNIIGLLVPSMSYSFFPEITDRIEDLCQRNNYYPIIFHTSEDYSRMANGIKLLIEMRAAGLIVTPPAYSRRNDIYRQLIKMNIPFIFIDRYIPEMRNSYVVTDAMNGSCKAVKYLADSGHKKILLIKGPEKSSAAEEVYLGYEKIMKEKGLKEMVVSCGSYEEKDGYEAGKEMIRKGMKPTAIFAVNDPVAIGVMQALDELKIKIPEDISVMGFSDISISSRLKIPLTTMKEYPEKIGEESFSLLNEMIKNGKRIVKNIRIDSDLVVRESTTVLSKTGR